jgi:hypothetical protein
VSTGTSGGAKVSLPTVGTTVPPHQRQTSGLAAVVSFDYTPARWNRSTCPRPAAAGPRWSNAGHLPPVVAGPDEQIRVLDGDRPELLLGVDADAPRRDHVVTIPRGSTVLLCTDGLVERRDQLFDTGVDRLRAEFGALWQEPVGPLVDQLLARLLPDRAEDDVALVAVRLRAQDRSA